MKSTEGVTEERKWMDDDMAKVRRMEVEEQSRGQIRKFNRTSHRVTEEGKDERTNRDTEHRPEERRSERRKEKMRVKHWSVVQQFGSVCLG